MAGTEPKEGGSPGFFATVRFAVLDKVEATIAIDQTTAIAFLIAFPRLTMVRSSIIFGTVGREDGRQASPSAVRRGQTTHGRSELPNALPGVAFSRVVFIILENAIRMP